ncbi:MAG TPA: hypothetical protein VGI45_23725 [Terracidiphilus sp.]|jgi:hypothetical protein
MNKRLVGALLSLLSFVSLGSAQTAPAKPAPDPFAPLSFLIGTWDAKTVNNPAVTASGAYTFRAELNGHILARHTEAAGCKGPEDFNCQHGDLLYIYTDGPSRPLRAIYFDNEGHVIHYSATTPTPTTAEFLSDPAGPGPQFRLTYELKDGLMSGKFQIRIPGQPDWKSYLEWTGSRK